MTDRELMQMVLEELEELADVNYGSKTVLQALRDRLAQPEPEPIAWLSKCYNDDNEFLGYTLWDRDVGEECFPVYTASSKREWVGLTDDEIKEIIGPWGDTPIKGYTRKLFDAIEAKLKEKNT